MTTTSPEPFYSLARRAGDFVFLSAFGPVDDRMEVVGTTIEEQTAACMEAVGRALRQEGADFGHLVCVDVFLRDLADRSAFNEVYARYFPNRHQMPARRLYGAGDLFKGIRLEVAGTAYLGSPPLAAPGAGTASGA
ncbi:MAG: RidA family protein [Candidatus Latescibacterota bacterium]